MVTMTKEIEIFKRCYRETVEFIMKEFQLTLEEACTYVNMNPAYSMAVKLKAKQTIMETNLKRNG